MKQSAWEWEGHVASPWTERLLGGTCTFVVLGCSGDVCHLTCSACSVPRWKLGLHTVWGPYPQHHCQPLRALWQCQASFFEVWFPSTAPDTHVSVVLDARVLQLTPG